MMAATIGKPRKFGIESTKLSLQKTVDVSGLYQVNLAEAM
jgi:hypothetical protein